MTIRQHKKNDFGSLIWSILILLLSVVTSFSQTTEQLNEILSAKLEVLAENHPVESGLHSNKQRYLMREEKIYGLRPMS